MAIEQSKIKDLTKEFGKDEKNTGSSESQIAILTERIRNKTNHLKNNKKDHSGRRGLLIMVSKRRKLLNYIKKNNINEYMELIKDLKIRK